MTVVQEQEQERLDKQELLNRMILEQLVGD
jgi:hypothetical protein